MDRFGQHPRRLLLFGTVGVANTAVDFGVYAAAIALGLPPAVSNIIGFAVANPFSYFMNSRVTFRVEGKPAEISLGGYGKFLAAHLISLALSTLAVFWLAPVIGPYLAKLAAIGLTVAINYGAAALFVFRKTETRE